jgi:purine-binding chemotaxis protein CheW
MPQLLTRVPLSGPEIAGILNLRGRIVTALDLRSRLGLAPRQEGAPPMAVGIEWRGESYGLLVDAVGEVVKLADSGREPNPVNLDAKLAGVSAGVHRLDAQLMVVLDIERVLGSAAEPMAA